ncbi:MAG: WD40/YVTN/BNR-like repeat-containing protein, partial [Thermoanaerobaculia bacterium]
YNIATRLSVSDDGGKTFTVLPGSRTIHGDYHALWINPKDPEHLIAGQDGGLGISHDHGETFQFVANLPLAQYYHVAVDLQTPYNVYGGLQDNGTWMGPSQASGAGVTNHAWRPLGGGDGFAVAIDSVDPDVVYLESQGGRLVRTRRSTGESKEIYPYASKSETKLRFNWNTPIVTSPTQKGTVYVGSQSLMRSRDGGESWERISGDLTTNDVRTQRQLASGGVTVDNSSAENYNTIITISESPKNPNVIWVGSDDGNVQVTTDGGKSWTNTVANVKGVPARTWVSRVEASHFDENTAYVTFDGHRTGDMKTYALRTRDLGRTWEPLGTADVRGWAHVIREDLLNPNLLFLGTEYGLSLSLDAGANWAQFKENFPPAPVNDVKIHPRDGDVIIGTHGRGIYVIDDLTPLRALTPDALAKDVVMLPSRASVLKIPTYEGRSEGDTLYASGSLEDVASISYYLKKRHVIGDSKIEIYDADDKLVATLPAGKRRGINRVDWPMRLPAPKMPAGSAIVFSGGAFFGPRAPAGTYTVKFLKGKETYTSTLELVPDTRGKYTAEDRAVQQKAVRRVYDMIAEFTALTENVQKLRDEAKMPAAKKKLDELYKSLTSTREGGWLSGEEQLRERLGMLYGAINIYDGRPTESQLAEIDVLAEELAKKKAQVP